MVKLSAMEDAWRTCEMSVTGYGTQDHKKNMLRSASDIVAINGGGGGGYGGSQENM